MKNKKAAKLLVDIHTLLWQSGERMNQSSEDSLKVFISAELMKMEHKGLVRLIKLENGFIKDVALTKKAKKS